MNSYGKSEVQQLSAGLTHRRKNGEIGLTNWNEGVKVASERPGSVAGWNSNG